MTFQRRIAAAVAGVGIAPLLMVALPAAPAAAHGYINSPPSRQAVCAQGGMSDCGDIVWEPQSVEGPKGQRNCHGGVGRFAQLNDDSRPWPTTSVGGQVSFNWVLTARHSTSTWEYFIGGTRVAVFNDGGAQPGATVRHDVNLGGFTGRQKLLAVWNIADTPMAFYSCVDLQIGGAGAQPPPQQPPVQQPPSSGTWSAGTAYTTGSVATFNGASYRCLQAHTALAGWEPAATPALWSRV